MNATSRKAKEIFVAALKLAPDQWDGHLAEACGDDDELRGRVRDLLQANAAAGSFLESPAAGLLGIVAEPIREGPGTVIGPYKLLEQIGEGGMGLVFLAEQQQPVRRKVALKIVKPGMDTRQVIARFEAERQALALMDHPNIARVLDAGQTGSGRPHFVMELVKGVPITDYCDRNRLTTRERLELFVHVCQAVQHAHHKGIIHRDIKPSNVMVTLHDDVPVVKVIDFGIAKALGQQLTDKTLMTGVAQMVGTPLYMSPEQAGMSGLDVDTRSDIYSLGVLLYELLTGTTPFDKERLRAAGYDEMRRIIREEEPARPSTRLSTLGQAAATQSAQRQSDPQRLSLLLRGELDWIVMKALDKDRTRRYETANGLARDVERYLHDEPVLACPPSGWYRCRKFARRHKTGLRIAAAAAVVLLLTAGGVSWVLWDQAARRTELSERTAETEHTVNLALIHTDQWRTQAGAAPSATSPEADAVLALWGQADASLAQAESALRTGTADDRLRQRVLDVRQEIEQQRAQAQRRANLLRDLDDARMTRSSWNGTQLDYAGAATKYAAAFAAYGLEVKPGRTEELVRRIRAVQPAIREALIVALDDWWQTARANANTVKLAKLVPMIAAAADDDPWRRQYRAATTARNAKALRALSGQARRLSLRPSSLELLAWSLRGQGDRNEALALLRWARGQHLTDFWIHFTLGSLLQQGEDKSPVILEEAIGCFRTALALRPAASAVHNELGICLDDRKQLDEAILCYRKAIESEPRNAPAHHNLGLVLYAKKDLEGAIREFQAALKIKPNFGEAHYGLGNALRDKKNLEGAIREFQAALKIKPNLASAHNGLGNALRDKKDVEGAIREFQAALKIDPNLAMAHNNVGIALRDKKDLAGAIREFQAALKIDPNLAMAHNNLGNAFLYKKDLDGAIHEFQAAIKIDPNLAWAHNNVGIALRDKKDLAGAIREFQTALKIDPNYAVAHNNLGIALHDMKDVAGAIREFQTALKIDPNYAEAHKNLGDALAEKKDVAGAIREFQTALKIDPNYAVAHYSLGSALAVTKQWDEAIAEYKQASKLDPMLAEAHVGIGTALAAKNQLDEAIAAYRQAIELKPKYALAYFNLGIALKSKNQLDEAIAATKMAIDLQPDYAEAYCSMADILRMQGQLSASLDFLQRSHALGSKRKDWHYPTAQWVATAERLVRLEAKLPDVLAGKATPTDNRERLGLLEVCRLQRRHAAAARLYADAFTADPKLANDLNAGHRYSAACAAALAAAGQGTDAGQLDDQTHRRLRQQALAWLRADLDAWNRLLDQGSDQARVARVTRVLQPWMVDIDLTGVRSPDALALLPQAERPDWQKFWQDVAALRQRAQKKQTLLEPVRVGQTLDLVGPTVEGKTFDLKLLRGKVVLIDFWATWCGPCVAEMPNVKGVYDRYHQDGFEVVGVSLDNSREALLQFLKAKDISWPQLFYEDSRAQGWKNPLARKYGIHAIPATILVNRAGMVAAVRVRGEALEPAVARLLGKTPAPPTAVASAVPAGQAPSFFRVTAVSLQAEPKEGPAPVRIVFRGKITTNGPGTVRYTFLRSDNARGPIFTLTFDKARVKEVSTSWQLGGPSSSYAGWQALKVLAPNEVISENARFKIEPSKGQQW